MNREQFIKTCIQSGYAGKQAAEKYADNSDGKEGEVEHGTINRTARRS